MSYSKDIFISFLLLYYEFLSVLDINTLGESFCRICMLANQFTLDAVDVITAGLICFDMANAGIDGLVEINHDGNNALGWDGNQLVQAETALDVLQVLFSRRAVNVDILGCVLSINIDANTVLCCHHIYIYQNDTFAIWRKIGRSQKLIEIFFLIGGMVDTFVTWADETAVVAEYPEVTVVGDGTAVLDITIALVVVIALGIHSQEIEAVLLSPFLLCERGPVAP